MFLDGPEGRLLRLDLAAASVVPKSLWRRLVDALEWFEAVSAGSTGPLQPTCGGETRGYPPVKCGWT